MPRAAEFYRDRLGFRYERLWGDPPTFTIVQRRGVAIMLSRVEGAEPRPNRVADPEGSAWDAYVWVDDADALHDELATKGVRIVRGLCDQIYACRDFEVEDLDGYRLCFGQPPARPASPRPRGPAGAAPVAAARRRTARGAARGW